MATLDQYRGCLLGLALGDALGAPREGGLLERALWRLIGRTRRGEMRWTDDTQMTIDVAESFLDRRAIDPDDLAIRFAKSYRWSRGYGPATAKLLKRIARGADWRKANRSVYPAGSFGNGAAMRAPLIGLIHSNQTPELVRATRIASATTHAHEHGIEGAVAVALATAHCALGKDAMTVLTELGSHCVSDQFQSRIAVARDWMDTEHDTSPFDVVRQLGCGVAAHDSCITAVYLALRFRGSSFLRMQAFIAACGGDVDTIGAMAGGIWGAANGATNLPEQSVSNLEQRERLETLAERMHEISNDDGPISGFPT